MSSNLKSKKLIILISVLVAVIAVVVILASVFSVRDASPVYYSFYGSEIIPTEGAPTADDVLKHAKGKSILFFSKDKLLETLNKEFPEWHAFAVVMDFPNVVNVHFVQRKGAVKVDIGGNFIYVDNKGFVLDGNPDYDCIDISSAFEHRDISQNEIGKKLQFVEENNNRRFDVVLNAINATWQCMVDFDDMSNVLGSENVFMFDEGENFVIRTRAEAQIKVADPYENLADRLISAYSVYYNAKHNLQQSGMVITVTKDGRIITSNPNGDK